MARNLDVFRETLVASGEPGIDALDPRFSAITALSSRGQYPGAADQIEEILTEGIYDIRLLTIYLFQAFRERGLVGLPDVAASVEGFLGESFEAIGPLKKREETFDRRIAWLFGEITDSLEYHAQKQSPEWAAYKDGVTAEVLDSIFVALDAAGGRIGERSFTHATRGLSRLKAWLSAQSGALVSAVDARGLRPDKPGYAPEPPIDQSTSNAPSKPAVAASADPGRLEMMLAVSHRFVELTQKLRAFEELIKKHEYRKAALVADDLQQIIEHFDPRSYFPEVFAGFSAHLSRNIHALAEHWDDRESVAWKALAQFYHVDLDGFVES